MHGHRSGPYSPHKMPQHLSGLRKSTDASGPNKMRGQRSGMCRSPEQKSGGSKMHRSVPRKMHDKMHERRTSPKSPMGPEATLTDGSQR